MNNEVREWAQEYIDKGMRPIPLYHPEHGCQCGSMDPNHKGKRP